MIYVKSKAKDIISDKKVIQETVHSTINKMAEIVGSTLGPGGAPVVIEREGMAPLITKDGVTVAKALGLADSASNLLVDAAKEICIKTAVEAGDGTTTAIVLANALVKHGQTFLNNNEKYSPQRLINELHDAYSKVVIPYLEEHARRPDTEEELRNVAAISANGDEKIANAVVEAVMAAGDDGKVLITEGQGNIIEVDTVEGYVITTGLKELGQIGPAFINDKTNQQVKMDNGYVFLYDGSLNDLKVPGMLSDELNGVEGGYDGRPIVVFAHEFADSVKDAFAKYVQKGITILPVKTPRSGLPQGASLFLQDMAAYTGASVYNPGNIDDDMDFEGFGCFSEARCNMYETFINGLGESIDIEHRITELRAIENAAFSELDKSFIRAAIAKLVGGVSTIIVGGTSDLEIREKKDRVEDAEAAVRAAIAEGVVPGGCSTHIVLSRLLAGHTDYKPSWDILIASLQAPFSLLCTNAGEIGELVQNFGPTVNENNLPSKIFDAYNHKMVEPFQQGIIEPAKVVRVSIANALSVASLLMTLGGIVVVPSNPEMDMQLELGRQAFSQMMDAAGSME